MKRISFLLGALALLAAAFTACDPDRGAQPAVPSVPQNLQQATRFASDLLQTYYLWSAQIQKDLPRLDPDTCTTPAAVVQEIRYHRNGREVDHWTELSDDIDSFRNYVQGLGMTYGYELQYGEIAGAGRYFLLVAAVYPDAPAGRAGLRRGDVIITLDGAPITRANLNNAFNSTSVTLGITHVTRDEDGVNRIGDLEKTVRLTAEDTYLNPVIAENVFDIDGKKVGYLCYNAFDLRSASTLPDVFRRFKEAGIRELVLDLRYNGGGFAVTENVLGSLIAPQANVDAGDVFQTEIFNDYLAEAWKKQGYETDTRFANRHTFKAEDTDVTVDITDAKPQIEHLYAIVTGSSASASEGLVVGLAPYLPVTLVGRRTYGKYCAGYILTPADIYNEKYDYSLIKDWGMYVMVSMFADKDGKNAAMPDGIAPDIEAEDWAFDGVALGDENEQMLAAALRAAGKTYAAPTAVQLHAEGPALRMLEHGAGRGWLVKPLPR